MVSSDSPIILPIVSIQHDFQTVISDVYDGVVPEEDIWLSCYKTDEPSVHGKVRVALGEKGERGSRDVELNSRDGVLLEKATRGQYTASCSSLAIPPTAIHVPRKVVRDTEDNLKTKQISALSVSSDLSQIAIGYADGTIRRLPLSASSSHATSEASTAKPLSYVPHLSGAAISSLRYFPSSRVLLSGGADFMLHILDADPALATPPKPVRSLKGHIRAVTDTAIIARGRNVLSGAKDGTVRLWDVGSGAQIRMMGARKYSPVNALSLGEKPSIWSPLAADHNDTEAAQPQATEPDSREVETTDKLVFLALQDGNFECVDLGSKTSVYHTISSPTYQKHGALTAIAYSPRASLLATGSTSGVISIYDTRSLSSTLCTFQRNTSSIEGLAFVTGSPNSEDGDGAEAGLAIATSDGLPFIAGVRPNGPEVSAELAGGGDCEAVRAVQVDERGGVWIAGDDGVVRMY
ncbi:WD40 repeat-like protein [Phellopilus nigrolimitatus]|nr:WD40 repeat-like protein [Phellopilus nigrolimitatus]